MKILAVFAHPNKESFTRALLDEFVTSAEAAGHKVDVLDLHAEGFDPRFNMDDVALYGGLAGITDEIAAQHKRVMDADAMAFFFPLWWWSMPAILKGWIDRVFTSEFAFSFVDNKSAGLLPHQKVALFCPAATDRGTYRRYGYHGGFQRLVDAGIFGYCGISDVETYIFPEVETDEDARAKGLSLTRNIAKNFEHISSLNNDAFH